MPEALARSRNDSLLHGAAGGGGGGARGRRFARGLLRRLRTRPASTIAGAAFAAVLVGILVNALALQGERSRAPTASVARSPLAEASSVAATAPAPDDSAAAATPPARPADLGSAIAAAPASPPAAPAPLVAARSDSIHDFLKSEAARDPDARRLTLAAQNALIKLGYVVKADGVAGASTLQSIRDFARAHGLSATEITPKLVRQLNAAASR